MKTIPRWKSKLIQNTYTHYPTCLLTTIEQRSPICIATDGSKSKNKCVGAWVRSTLHVKLLAYGSNLDCGSMDNMHSNLSEAYEMLSVFIFFNKYSKLFSVFLSNKFTIYCDNKEIVTKVHNIYKKNYSDIGYQTSEHEAIMAIKSYLPKRYEIFHLYGH